MALDRLIVRKLVILGVGLSSDILSVVVVDSICFRNIMTGSLKSTPQEQP